MKKAKCEACEDTYIIDEEIFKMDNGEMICETCEMEAEPIADVIFSNEESEKITPYTNNTDFEIEYKSTDAWRGYYDIKNAEGWTNVHSDCILSMSEDADELKNFDEEFEKYCEAKDIVFAKVICRSSNLFSNGYDLFVRNKDVDKVKAFVTQLKDKHRDDERFNTTTLIGTSTPNETDKMFIKATKLLKKGMTPKEAVMEVRKNG